MKTEKKIKATRSKRNSRKKEKARLESKKNFKAQTVEKESDVGKLNVKLHKLVITKFQGKHLDCQRF